MPKGTNTRRQHRHPLDTTSPDGQLGPVAKHRRSLSASPSRSRQLGLSSSTAPPPLSTRPHARTASCSAPALLSLSLALTQHSPTRTLSLSLRPSFCSTSTRPHRRRGLPDRHLDSRSPTQLDGNRKVASSSVRSVPRLRRDKGGGGGLMCSKVTRVPAARPLSPDRTHAHHQPQVVRRLEDLVSAPILCPSWNQSHNLPRQRRDW